MHLTPDVIMPSPNGAIKEETVEEDKDDDIVKIQSQIRKPPIDGGG